MELSVQDKNSATWLKIDRFLTEQIDSARKKNDAPLDHDKTTEVRGCIRALKALQSLGDETQEPLLPD